jgi:hypothetical protein
MGDVKEDDIEQRESEQGFSTGFNNVQGDRGKTEKAREDEAKAATEKAAADKAVTEKAAAEKAETERTKFISALPGRLRNIEGHIGGINSKLDAVLKKAGSDAAAAGAAAPSKEQVAAAQQSSERWKKLEQDFPEWAAALNERLTAVGNELQSKFPKVDHDAIKKEIMTGVAPLIESAKSEGRALALVDLKHEGWEDTVKTKEFGDWLKKQSPETQALADSEKASDAIKLLDAYVEHSSALKKAEEDRLRKEKRLTGALTPVGIGQSGGGSGISDEEAFTRGFKRVRGAK